MRQFYKKISSVCMAFLCVAALLIGCTATAWAADEVDDSVKSQLVTTTKGPRMISRAIWNQRMLSHRAQQAPGTVPEKNLVRKKVISMKKISQ